MSALMRLLCVFIILCGSAAFAQSDYPSRTIRLIVPTSAGGGTDIVARLVAQHLAAAWGQPVVVENRGGGAGIVGAVSVAKAAPDGYTLLVPFGGVLTINPYLYKELGFDSEKDFVPITMLASAPYLMLVNPKIVAATTIREFIDYAKSQQVTLNYGSTNKGSPDHLAGELFNMMTGLKMNHIPYRGSADTIIDLLGGRMPLGYTTIPSAISYVESGALRAIGVSDLQRSPLLPNVPTIAESGLPGFEIRTWFAAFAPSGTPDAVVQKLYSGIKAVLQKEEVQKRLFDLGYSVGGMPPAEFAIKVKSEHEKYGKIINTIGLEKN